MIRGLSIIAPNLSVTAYVLSQAFAASVAPAPLQLDTLAGPPSALVATATAIATTSSAPSSPAPSSSSLPPLPSLNVTVTSISTWGRTLSHMAGVPPQLLGLEANAAPPSGFDAFLVDPISLVDMYDANLTLDLSQMVVDAPYKEQIEWVGIHKLFRGSVVVAQGAVSSLPFGGLVYQMYYRHDVLKALNLEVPATWEEFMMVAKAANGTDMNGDGVHDYGVCLQRPRYCFNGFNLAAIWSSFIQTQGTRQGAFFDPVTMRPLVNNSAMRQAMELYAQLKAYGPADETTAPCLPFNMAFVRGRCALTLSWGYQLKANTFLPFSAVKDKVSVALLPGSTKVLNRTTGELEECASRAVCPYADELPGPDGRPRLVNRAPYLALATVSAAVSSRAGVWQQTNLMSVFALLSSSNVSWDIVTSPVTELGPYRYEHFDPANLWRWERRGYPRKVISEFLQVMKAQVDSENVMLEVRTLQAYAYRRALDKYATAISEGTDVSEALANMTQALAAVYNRKNARFDCIKRYYLYSIGYLDGVGPSAGDQSVAGTRAPGLGRAAGIGAAVVLVVMVIAASVVVGSISHRVAQQRKLRYRSEWRPKGHPGLGDDTTLVVSDVEGSTALWEAVEPAVMDLVFNLHHNCMRRTAVRYNGYESQTEGDSFIIAFHYADDAAHFALAVQAALLEEPWPPELLEQEKCRPVWLARTAVEVPLDLPLESAAAHHHFHYHHRAPVTGVGSGGEHTGSRQGTSQLATTPGSPGDGAGSASVGAATPSPAAHAPAGGSYGLGLRRLLARRRHRRGIQHNSGSVAGGEPGRSESAHGGCGAVSGRPEGASQHGNANGGAGGVHSGPTMAPQTPRVHPGIDTVAEALRAMWREMPAPGTGLEPWGPGGGGPGLGGLARWQELKAAFKTTLSSRIAPSLAAAAVASASEWAMAEDGDEPTAALPLVGDAAPAPAITRSRSLPSDRSGGSRRKGHVPVSASRHAASGSHALQVRSAHGGSQHSVHASGDGDDSGIRIGGDGSSSSSDSAVGADGDEPDGKEDHALDGEITARTLSGTVPARGNVPLSPPPAISAGAVAEAKARTLPGATQDGGASGSLGAAPDVQVRSRSVHVNFGGGGAAAARAAFAAGAGSKSLGRRIVSAVVPGGLMRSVSIGLGRRHADDLQLTPPAQSARWDVGLWALRAAAAAAPQPTSTTTSRRARHSICANLGPLSPLAAVDERVATDHGGHSAALHGHGHGHGAPEHCTLVRRGLLVRIGMHTGVRHATDLQYSEVAARWKYSGEVLAAAKAVSDAANGGDVLISASTLGRISTELLTKRTLNLLFVGRHVLRGGDTDAAAAAATASTASAAAPPPPPAPGGVADLYALYSPRLLPRLGLYRAPRTAQPLGLSALEAPLGCLSYGMLVCHGLAAMAQQSHHSSAASSLISEAQAALGSIATDQLHACHGVAAAAPPSAGAVGTVVGAFQNPYHAILWALQAQEDLLRHPWSAELLAHEHFEEILAPAAADALTGPDPQRRHGHGGPPQATPPPPPTALGLHPDAVALPPQPPSLTRHLSTHVQAMGWEAERLEEADVPTHLITCGTRGSGGGGSRGSGGGARGSSGGGGSGAHAESSPAVTATSPVAAPSASQEVQATGGLVWAFSSSTRATKSNRSVLSCDGAAAAGAVSLTGPASGGNLPFDTAAPPTTAGATLAADTAPPAAGLPISSSSLRFVRISAPCDSGPQPPLSPRGGGGGTTAAAVVGSTRNATGAPVPLFPDLAPYDISTYDISSVDPDRDSNNAMTGQSLAMSGGFDLGPPAQLATPLLLPTPASAAADPAAATLVDVLPPAPESPLLRTFPALPSLAPSAAPSLPGTASGMAPGPVPGPAAVAGGLGEREVLLFRGPRIKAAISYGPLKASLDPLTGRIRYEGKPVGQAVKMVSYAAIGMVVASVEAVEAGHAEDGLASTDGLATGTGYGFVGTPRAGILGGGGGGGGPASDCGDGGGRSVSLRGHVPPPISRADSFRNDPDGPSAAMAAAAAAAAAALLNLAPYGGGVMHIAGSVSQDMVIGVTREDSLAQLAATLSASGAATQRAARRGGGGNSGGNHAHLPAPGATAARAGRRQARTSDAEGRSSDARSSNSGPLGVGGVGNQSVSPAGESRFPSGYSTPYSGQSYTYAQNPLFGYSVGTPSGGAGGGAGGGGSALKPDSRAPSRTARTMSNLNPDSRQASRTLMPRQSGVSITGGNGSGGILAASPPSQGSLPPPGAPAWAAPALRRSPSPDSLRRLAGLRGSMRPLHPPSLSRGASSSRAEAADAAAGPGLPPHGGLGAAAAGLAHVAGPAAAAGERLVGLAQRGGSGGGEEPPYGPQLHPAVSATAAAGTAVVGWRSGSLQRASRDPLVAPAAHAYGLGHPPSPPRQWASQHQMLQQRDSQRVFPGTGGGASRAAAVLPPSVQVLSHGHGPGLYAHLHQQQPQVHGGGDTLSGSPPTADVSFLSLNEREPGIGGVGGGSSGAAAAFWPVGAGRPPSGAQAPHFPYPHGPVPPGHSVHNNPLSLSQLQPAASWRSTASGAPGLRGPMGAPAMLSSPALHSGSLFATGSRKTGSQWNGRGAGPGSGTLPARGGQVSTSGGSAIGAAPGGAAGAWQPDSNGTDGLPKMLESVGLDEVAMLPVVLKKATRGSSQPLVVYLCRFASSAKTFEMQQRLVSLGRGEASTAAAAAAAVAAAAEQQPQQGDTSGHAATTLSGAAPPAPGMDFCPDAGLAVKTMSVKRVQRGVGLSGPLNPIPASGLTAAMSATLPHVRAPHGSANGGPGPGFMSIPGLGLQPPPSHYASLPLGPPVHLGAQPQHVQWPPCGNVPHAGSGMTISGSGSGANSSSPWQAVASSASVLVAQRALFRSHAGGGGSGGLGGGSQGSSAEEITAAGAPTYPSVPVPTLSLASAADWGPGAGASAYSQLMYVGGPAVSESGAAVSSVGLGVGLSGVGGGGMGAGGPGAGSWEFPNPQGGGRVVGSGRGLPPMMSPTEEGHETEAEAE
ncbi:hypothetical protein GPECTOR_13g798 [Gonium pectorale]|uniref:Guanylate cyclase domain-containing protein n=1 Tax=Gonium pectorale TaxID=33097 RepID=A0A150GNE0_GONPE|nr:hypothetical protein GPECTOR_13g798 [Gonium pectorale]|eukprot:KXZ51311.1 hypothetical protein GPECTOR_13g798 [Gonium pectorale]